MIGAVYYYKNILYSFIYKKILVYLCIVRPVFFKYFNLSSYLRRTYSSCKKKFEFYFYYKSL